MADYLTTCPTIPLSDRRRVDAPPDPYTSFVSGAFPRTLQDGFRWIERIVLRNGHYREAIRRLIAYFVTDITITDATGADKIGEDEQRKYKDFLENNLKIREHLMAVGEDWLIYGNHIGSVLQRFESWLTCKACGWQQPFSRVAESPSCGLSFAGWEYRATCSRCKHSGEFRRTNTRIAGVDGIWLKRWSPYEINLAYSSINDASQYFWAIPERTRTAIRTPGPGKWWELQNAPEEVIEAVKTNSVIRLNHGLIYHAKELAPAGIDTAGWGFSRVLSNFSQSWYYQVLSRANETLASGYASPLPVLSPAQPPNVSGAGDPLFNGIYNPQDFAAHVSQLVAAHKQQANSLYTMPVPFNFQLLGGDLSKIISEEQLEAALARLLDCVGVPVQLYRGDLTMETAVPAMRLHEAYHAPLVNTLNGVLQNIVDATSQLLNWEPVKARLKKVRHADDVSRSAMLQQLAVNKMVSRSTALAAIDVSAEDEDTKIMEDDLRQAEMSAKAQQKLTEQEAMQQLTRSPGDPAMIPLNQGIMALQPPMPGAAPGGAPGGAAAGMPAGGVPAVPGVPPVGGAGAPAPGGQQMLAAPQGAAGAFNSAASMMSGQPLTVQELSDKATGIAQTVLSWPDSQRRSYLAQLKRREPQLHAIVSSIVDEERRKASLIGRDAVLQQQFGAV